MTANRHKNRRALIVRLDETAEDSAWKDDGLEGMIMSVDYHIPDVDKEGKSDYYSGEVIHPPEQANILIYGNMGVRGKYTILFSRAFNKKEKDRQEIYGIYGESKV